MCVSRCQNNKDHLIKLSSGDKRTLQTTFTKFERETSLFTSKQIQDGEHLYHVKLNFSSAHEGLLRNAISFLITISSCQIGIRVKHSCWKRCLGITWMWNVLRCLFSMFPRSPSLNSMVRKNLATFTKIN